VRLLFLFLLATCSASYLHAADVPEVFNYQGRLLDEEGHALSGSREALFGIYEAPAGGTALWEQKTTVFTDTNGLFNVTLGGTTNSLSAAVGNRFGGLYLDMAFKVGGVMEPVRPRPQFVSVPYAKLAENVAGAQALEVTSNLVVRQKAQLGVLNADQASSDLLKADQITVPRVVEVGALSAYTDSVLRVQSPAVFNGFSSSGRVVPPPSQGVIASSSPFGSTWHQVTSDQWLTFTAQGANGGSIFIVKVCPTRPSKYYPPDQTSTDDPRMKIYQSEQSVYGIRLGLCVPIPAGYWVGCYASAYGGEMVGPSLNNFFGSVVVRMDQGL